MGCVIELGELGVGRWQEQSQVGETSCSPRHGSVMESQGPPDMCVGEETGACPRAWSRQHPGASRD